MGGPLYCLNFNDKIKDLSVKDPKEFWKLINKHDPKNDSVNDVPDIKDFSDHFKSLNDGICIDENKEAQLKLTASNSSTNDVLDCPLQMMK